MRRLERREQILAAATRAFARAGFAATSLEDIAAEAAISRVILYRHFDSKTELYHAVLERATARLGAAVGYDQFTANSIEALLEAAAADPDGFRLLFHHAAREREFRAEVDGLRAASVAIAHRYLAAEIRDPDWADWAAHLVPTVAVESVITWLDAGQPDPRHTADRIRMVLSAVVAAAQQS